MTPQLSPDEASTVGQCPDCGAALASYDVLIEYETGAGERACWAGCPQCQAVVHPDRNR